MNTDKKTRFGMLTIIEQFKKSDGKIYCQCSCECGGTKVIRKDSLTRGMTKSCGCLQKQTQFKAKDIADAVKNDNIGVIESQIKEARDMIKRAYLATEDEMWKRLKAI